MEKTLKIIQQNVHEVLDKYLAGELAYDIEHEILHGIEWDLAHEGEEDSHD